MAFTSTWTDKEIATVKKAIAKATSKDEAVYLAQKALPKRKLSAASIDCALRRHGGSTIRETIASRTTHTAKKPEQRIEEDLAEKRLREQLGASEADRKVLLATVEDLRNQVAQIKELRAMKPVKPVTFRKKVGGKQRQGCPVGVFSDWHVEERVDPKNVNGLNEYNLEIAESRIDQLAEAFAWMVNDSRYDCRSAILAFLGDHFSGFIHEELMEKNWLSPVSAVKWLAPRIVAMIRKILHLCPTIERLVIPCVDGNHGRLTHKIRVQSRTDNSLEWLMFHQLAAMMLDEPRVQFQIADGEYNYVDIGNGDRRICFFHGDSVKYAGGVGGILVPLLRGLNELRKYQRASVFCLGHFHQLTFHDDVVVNGSMIGTTAYALRYKFAPQRPAQAFWMEDPFYGKTLQSPLLFK